MRLPPRDRIEQEIARLHQEGAKLEREWHQVPYLFALVLLAGPVFWIWGPVAGFYTILGAPSLVVTAYYLVGVRRSENRELLRDLERQLAAYGPAPDDAASAS